MSYLFGIGGVLLLQALFSLAVISATSGNGSFVGLGAMLLAMIGIPVTAILNFEKIRAHRANPARGYVVPLIYTSLILPAAQLGLAILVAVFDL